MKIVGILLIVFGLADLVGSFAGVDVWGEYIGVELPELLWRFSAYIEMGLGYFLFSFGNDDGDESEADGTPSE